MVEFGRKVKLQLSQNIDSELWSVFTEINICTFSYFHDIIHQANVKTRLGMRNVVSYTASNDEA